MNTDDLSEETYRTVMLPIGKFHHDLALQFGLLASGCEDENEYLQKCTKQVKQWNRNIKYVIEDIFFNDPPEMDDFKHMLQTILDNIANVEKIPIEKRHFDF